jgi:hypothetical protein
MLAENSLPKAWRRTGLFELWRRFIKRLERYTS